MSNRNFCALAPFIIIILGLAGANGQAGEGHTPAPRTASFQTEACILAVVNGNIITESDIQTRLALLVAASGARPSAEMLPQIKRTILQTLIEEYLKIQEAARIARLIKRSSYISDADVQRMLTLMIRRSGLSPELFNDFLKVHHIPRETLILQARAQASWNRLIHDLYGESIQISDKDVDRVRAQFIENRKQGAVLLSRIVLPFETPEQEKSALADMGRIMDLLNQGANFSTLAQQFSKAPEAFKGGTLGWVTETNLSSIEKKVLKDLPIGHISAPFQKRNAYVILLCQDKRLQGATTFQEITMQRFFIPAPYALDSEEKAQTFVSQAHEVREHLLIERDPKKTEDLFSGLKVMPSETLPVEEIDPKLRSLLSSIETRDISPPVVTPDGVLLLAVYKREERPLVPPMVEDIKDDLRNVQLEKCAERHLRMLKRSAYIEIRG
ncbi:MAG: peptidylprolyl isomerase [Holosporales bacterium]|nr:peptidylprolyl isomerase [Holosporales bacterium]